MKMHKWWWCRLGRRSYALGGLTGSSGSAPLYRQPPATAAFCIPGTSDSNMPAFEIDTNAPQDKITPQLTKELTELLAEMLSLDVKVRCQLSASALVSEWENYIEEDKVNKTLNYW